MGDRRYRVDMNSGSYEEWENISGAVMNTFGAMTLHRDNIPVVIYSPSWWLRVTLVEPEPEIPPTEGGE